MGIADWFQTFHANLAVTQVATISTRYRRITRRLNTDFWTTTSESSHSRYVGSYGRNTAADPFSDLDMIFELPSALYFRFDRHAGNGQSALLQLVKSSVAVLYPSSAIKGDGQVISVRFTDGIEFEIVPVFLNKAGSYTFPNANGGGSWKVTNPKPEIDAMQKRNLECNRNLVRVCRMARAWKRQWNVPVGGLLLDTFAYQFIESYDYRGKSYFYFDLMWRDFLLWISERDPSQTVWRAPGSGQYVEGTNFRAKAKKCHALAVEAIRLEGLSPKREVAAKSKWREIFGNKFPP